MKNYKLILSIVLFFSTNLYSQNIAFNKLLLIKQNGLDFIQQNVVGNNWSIVSITENEYNENHYIMTLENDSKENKLRIYFRDDNDSIYLVSLFFNSESIYQDLNREILDYLLKAKKSLTWSELKNERLVKSYERDDLHIELIANSKNNLLVFTEGYNYILTIDNNFPELYTEIVSKQDIDNYKRVKRNKKIKYYTLPSSFIYYDKLIVGANVREFVEESNTEKIPKDGEYSILSSQGISVVVKDGKIREIKTRKGESAAEKNEN